MTLLLWLLLCPLVVPAWLFGMARAGHAYDAEAVQALTLSWRYVYAGGAVVLAILEAARLIIS